MHRPAPLETILSPIEPAKQSQIEEEEEEQNFDVPLSREEKPEAYPDGPICVYEPNIDLYLEPTAEQCRKYDVILNVASEVRNPLLQHIEPAPQEPDIRIDGGGGIQFAPKRPSLQPATDEVDQGRDSPTTPKATPLNSKFPEEATKEVPAQNPEYIHIKWEHNSDIVPDLLRLCKLLDEKAKQSKRVLVHCQCGVSRSASLVVAYGLYKDPTMSVQEAYDAVKKRSKWIGPNMNLIMQLQEFRTSLTRGGLLPGNRGFTPITPSSAYNEWRGPFASKIGDSLGKSGPMSAGVANTTQTIEDHLQALTPGPSSAPSGLKWPVRDQRPSVPTQRARAVSAVKPATAYVDPSGHIVPVLKVVESEPRKRISQLTPELNHDEQDSATPTESIASPRSAEFAMTPLHPSKEVDSADAFGIMSPTSTEFSSSIFDRSALLASLGMGSMQADDAPRRSLSLRSRERSEAANTATPQQQAPALQPAPRLRGKISSPSLREQQELQSLQARIEASLPHRTSPSRFSTQTTTAFGGMDDALMSPRATEFTKNPFALALSIPEEDREAATNGEEAPRSSGSDPRSPAQTGVSPITRNILDVL
jgi:tyrosine-protein phosphatase MSG5